MIQRSSSSIADHLINKNKEREAFREVQNTTQSSQNGQLIKLVNQKINESNNFDEINNSENTKIIYFRSTHFQNEKSFSFQETFSDQSDLNEISTINSDDNLYDEINEFLIPNNGIYTIGNEKFEIHQDLMLKSIEIVETYNQVLCSMFSPDLLMEKLNFKQFIKSILNLEKFYFKLVVKSLVQIISHSEINSLNKIQLFNVNLLYLLRNNNLSDRIKILILIKILESQKISNTSIYDKTMILTKNFCQIENKIEKISDLNELRTVDKLDLIDHLIEILISKKSNYHSKLEEIEKKIYTDKLKLEDLNEKLDLNNFKLNNISKFLIENDDSLLKKNLNELKNTIILKQTIIDDSKRKIESMLRCAPFSVINLESQNISLHFWRFNCLNNYLCIEKRLMNDNYNFCSPNIEFSQEKSAWFIINDRASIIELKKTITAKISDLNFENTMLKIITSNLNEPSFTYNRNIDLNNKKEMEQDSEIILYLGEFKQRIEQANFLFYNANLDLVFNNSIKRFEITEAYFKYTEIISKISDCEMEEKINIYNELSILLYKMINYKFLTYKFSSNYGSLWLNMVAGSKSLDDLKLYIFFLHENVLWNKKMLDTDCLICKNSTKNQLLTIKITCNECLISCHTDCYEYNIGKTILDSNNNPFLVRFFKSKTKYLCCLCHEKSVEKIKTETQLKLQKIDVEVNQLNAIRINKYSLRLNKQRAYNLDNSSSDESVDRKGKKRKKIVKNLSEESLESPINENQFKIEEIDLKRARLGLRIRPKTRKMF